MPASITHPSVYVEELPSGAHTIPGVPTSITAFVGRTARVPDGPEADAPRRVLSFRDFEAAFGPRDAASPMSHAVHAFFVNGGSEEVIVRVAGDDGAPLTDADDVGDADAGISLRTLRALEMFNLLCIPPDRRDAAVTISDAQALKTIVANPLLRLPMTLAEIFPVGVLMSLVSAAVPRNPRALPARG